MWFSIRALPVEKLNLTIPRIDQNMLGVKVGMIEAGIMQLGQCRAESLRKAAARTFRQSLAVAQELAKVNRLDQLFHQEKGTSVVILADRQPFRTGNTGLS